MNKLEKMTQEREENFKEIGRMTLQVYYYVDRIMNLCERQEKLCGKINELVNIQIRKGTER